MDPQQRRPVWRRPSVWLVFIAVLVLAMAMSVVFSAWFVNGHRPPTITIGVLAIVTLVFLGVGLAVGARTRRKATWSPLFSMEHHERRQLMRALRRNDPIPPEQHETAKIALRQLQRVHWINLSSAGLLFISNVGAVIGNPTTSGRRWFQSGLAVVVVVYLAVLGWSLIRYRRTARSLQTSAREETADGAGAD